MNFFLAVDPSLGKVDKASLSQQTLMELLIEGLIIKERLCGSGENPNEISEWSSITLNDSKEVVTILWFLRDLSGSIALEWLPLTVKSVNLAGNGLSGTVDLTSLPDSLEVLYLSNNRFEGTVDLTHLPPKMRRLLLNWNSFYGETDLSHLPESLKVLDVSRTQLKGEIHAFDGNLVVNGSNVKDKRKN